MCFMFLNKKLSSEFKSFKFWTIFGIGKLFDFIIFTFSEIESLTLISSLCCFPVLVITIGNKDDFDIFFQKSNKSVNSLISQLLMTLLGLLLNFGKLILQLNMKLLVKINLKK